MGSSHGNIDGDKKYMSFKLEVTKTAQENMAEKIKRAIVQGLYIATNIVHSQTVRDTPVQYGALKNDNEMKVDEENLEGIVYNSRDYAPYVEFGQETGDPSNVTNENNGVKVTIAFAQPSENPKSPRNVGRIPFMRPALYENEDKIVAALYRPLNKILNSPWGKGKTETLRI